MDVETDIDAGLDPRHRKYMKICESTAGTLSHHALWRAMPPEMSTHVQGHQVSWCAPILHFRPYILPRKLRGWTGHVSQFCCKPVEPWPILEETSSSVGNFPSTKKTFPCCHPFSTPETPHFFPWGTNEIPNIPPSFSQSATIFANPRSCFLQRPGKSQGVASNFPNNRWRWRSSKSNTFLSISGGAMLYPCWKHHHEISGMDGETVKPWNPKKSGWVVEWLGGVVNDDTWHTTTWQPRFHINPCTIRIHPTDPE